MTRTVYPAIPPRVDHELTDPGRELRKPVAGLALWACRNIARINAALVRLDGRADRTLARNMLQSSEGTGIGLPSSSSATMTKSAWVTRSIRSER